MKNKIIKLDIQDVITKRFVIPYHNGLGLPTASSDSEVGVRCIDACIEINVRHGKTITFKPGSPNSNIENIISTCTLLNDLLTDDLESRLPEKPKLIKTDIDQWNSYVISDTLPVQWFIYHRDKQILQVHIEISYGDEQIFLESGTKWEDAISYVEKALAARELKSIKKSNSKKDYSSVISKPKQRVQVTEEKREMDNSRIDDFLKTAGEILK